MNVEKGFNEFISIYSKEIDFTKDISFQIRYQKNQIVSDTGLFYSSISQPQEYINIKSIIVSEKARNDINGKFETEFSYFLDKMENSFYRNYMKLDSLFANIGAFSSIFKTISYMLSKIINYKALELKLINKFFDLTEEKEKDKEKFNKLRITKQKIVNKTDSIQRYTHIYPSFNYVVKNIRSIHFSNNDKLEFSVFNFCCMNKRKKFDVGLNALEFNLDIIVLLKRILNMDIIKDIVIQKDLLKLINAFRMKIFIDEFSYNKEINKFNKENFIYEYRGQREYVLNLIKRFRPNNFNIEDFRIILKRLNLKRNVL